MTRTTPAARLLLAGVGLLTLLAACSSTTQSATTTTTAPPGSSTPTTPVATTPPSAAPATTVALDAAATLQAAIAALTPNYHYVSTITVGGKVALTAEGDAVGDGTRLTVTGDGGAVNYVIVPAGVYIQAATGGWDKDTSPPATANPLAALDKPSSVTVDSNDGTTVALTVMVSATSLGIAGDAQVPVHVVVTGGHLTSALFQTTVNNVPAEVKGVFSAVVDSTPIVAPV